MNRRFQNAALDIPGIGRFALLSHIEEAVKAEAQDLMLAVVGVRARALFNNIRLADCEGLSEVPSLPQEVTIYDADKPVATLKPGLDAAGNSCPEYTAVQ